MPATLNLLYGPASSLGCLHLRKPSWELLILCTDTCDKINSFIQQTSEDCFILWWVKIHPITECHKRANESQVGWWRRMLKELEHKLCMRGPRFGPSTIWFPEHHMLPPQTQQWSWFCLQNSTLSWARLQGFISVLCKPARVVVHHGLAG